MVKKNISLHELATLEDPIKEIKSLKDLPDTKPLALINDNGVIVYVNQKFKKLFSLLPGDNFTNLNSDTNLQFVIEKLCKSHYSSFHLDFFITESNKIKPEGYFIDIERIFLDNTELFILILTSRSEREKLEDRINNLHNAIEYGNVAVIITDKDGYIQYSSKAFEKILDKTIENIYRAFLPDVLKNFLSEPESDSLKESIKKREKWVKLISGGETSQNWHKEIKLNPIKNSSNNISSFILIANDITEYVLKNRVIKRSEQRQKSIINNISDPLLILSQKNGNVKFENANENFYSFFSVEKPTKSESDLTEIIPEELYLTIMEAIQRIQSSKRTTYKFKYNDLLKGYKFICKLVYIKDPYDNSFLYIISFNDITEQSQIQEELRKAYSKELKLNKLKSTFLANMSHEIRTPLNAIVGYSDIIEDDLKNNDVTVAIEMISYLKDGVNRLLHLIDNIIEISLLESGEQSVELQKTLLNNILINVGEKYYHEIKEKNIKIEYNLDNTLNSIYTDELKLTKIVELLVENAIKYNKRFGKVIIKSLKKKNTFKINISDTGKGIEEDKIQHILEPFAQEDDEGYTRSYEGAGLGISIAYRMTQLLNGKFKIESTLAVGTTVSLEFSLR